MKAAMERVSKQKVPVTANSKLNAQAQSGKSPDYRSAILLYIVDF